MVTFLLHLSFLLTPLIFSDAFDNNQLYYHPTEHILLDCGSSSNSYTSDGRYWYGDVGTNFSHDINLTNISFPATATEQDPSLIQQVPYMTARIILSQFSYTFLVSPGQKILRFFSYGFGRKNALATVATIVITLLNIAMYHIRRLSESNSDSRNFRSSSSENHCRQFSIDEIRSTTNNFNAEFLIGSGGYGRVYKGCIDRGATVVAIKRLKSESRQGDTEFWTEIKMLSKLRHVHLVPLIGYCNDGRERVLVYEYMPRGTLADHLYNIGRHGIQNSPLSWEQRLKISIGAARGLYFLHTSWQRVIHRDVTSSNILLDENWVAKISDFGLSKMGAPNESFTHISTNVKGTFGYLDPEYFLTRKLTRKSDVYAFGVVLFEVLSGRPAVDIRLQEEQHSLAAWARYCIRKGKVDRLIDSSLIDQISPACLKVFVAIAGRCLDTHPHERPAMAGVVESLELALVLQQILL